MAKPGYGVIDNGVPADLCDALIEVVPGATIESAGSLYTPGKVVWFLVRLPDSKVFGTDGGETHERYVMITTSHDGSSALTIRPTNVRVQCMNTHTAAFGNASMYTIKHTTNALDYVEEARKAIQFTYANADAFDAEVQRLLDESLAADDFANFVIPEVIDSRPQDAGRSQTVWDQKFAGIVEFYNADHNEAIRGTAWGAVQAVNEFETWAIKPRGRELWEAQFTKLLNNDYPMTKTAQGLFAPV
jgi:phage/plasmid-like protein (TIGR03299 family)